MRLDYPPAFLVNLVFGAFVFILAGYSLERQVRKGGNPRRAPLPSALLNLSLVAMAMLQWTDPVQLVMEQLQIQDRTYPEMVLFLGRLRFQESLFYLACVLIGSTSLMWIGVELLRTGRGSR